MKRRGLGGEEVTRRTAAQTPRHKIHNLIQLSKLLSTFWTAATHAVPSPRIPWQLRSKGAGVLPRENIALDVSSHDTRTSGISLFLHFGRFTDAGVYKVRLDSSIERARPSCNRD